MPNDSIFQSLDASALQANLTRLLELTAREKGRIEITNADGGRCVIVSKEELDGLEQALEILSSTHDGQVLHQSVEHFAHMAEPAQPQQPIS